MSEQQLPDETVLLSEFADRHAVNRNEAVRLWRTGSIHGQKLDIRGNVIALASRGRREFWVQFHNASSFRACDECPHEK